MHRVLYLVFALSLTAIAYDHPGDFGHHAGPVSHIQGTCHQIAAAVSNVSDVYFPRVFSPLEMRLS